MATASKQMSEWVPKLTITSRHLYLQPGLLCSILSLLCPCSSSFCAWTYTIPHLLWFTHSHYSARILSPGTRIVSNCLIYIINLGLPGERCKANILRSNIIAENHSHRPRRVCYAWGFGTKGGLTWLKNLSSLEGLWCQARTAVAWEAGLETSHWSPAFYQLRCSGHITTPWEAISS